MARHPKSIGTEALVQDWSKRVPTDVCWSSMFPWRTLHGYQVAVTLRRCSRGDQLTGGLALQVNLPPPDWQGPATVLKRRLRPNYTREAFAGAVRGLYFATRDAIRRQEAQVALFRRVEPLPQTEKDALEAQGEHAGRPITYAAMNPDDCTFYHQLLDGCSRKEVA